MKTNQRQASYCFEILWYSTKNMLVSLLLEAMSSTYVITNKTFLFFVWSDNLHFQKNRSIERINFSWWGAEQKMKQISSVVKIEENTDNKVKASLRYVSGAFIIKTWFYIIFKYVCYQGKSLQRCLQKRNKKLTNPLAYCKTDIAEHSLQDCRNFPVQRHL